MEDDLKKKMIPKIKTTPKLKMDPKMKTTLEMKMREISNRKLGPKWEMTSKLTAPTPNREGTLLKCIEANLNT